MSVRTSSRGAQFPFASPEADGWHFKGRLHVCLPLWLLCGGAFLLSCAAAPQPLEVRRNFEENYAVRQIFLGYYAPEDVPNESIVQAKRTMAESIPCPGFTLLEEGMADRSEPVRTYDSFTKVMRTYSEVKSYYWQKYRCAEPMKPPPVNESKVQPARTQPETFQRPKHKPLPQ